MSRKQTPHSLFCRPTCLSLHDVHLPDAFPHPQYQYNELLCIPLSRCVHLLHFAACCCLQVARTHNTAPPPTMSREQHDLRDHARPLFSMAELARWDPRRCPDPLNRASVPLLSPQVQQARRSPLVLHCHDMSGGYVAGMDIEALIGPPSSPGPRRTNWYDFRHWELVDLFVYFSHHRVTVPRKRDLLCTHSDTDTMLMCHAVHTQPLPGSMQHIGTASL